MLPTLLAASAHHILAVTLVGILAAELALVSRKALTPEDSRFLTRIDLVYGLVALALLLIGLWRAYAFEKGLEFYLTSPWFWLKLGSFLLVALLSIPPTLRFRAWARPDAPLPGPEAIAGVRRWVMAEAALLLLIPVAAALMARGY
jgi:putative membrane protein